jgi:hypothetical protein
LRFGAAKKLKGVMWTIPHRLVVNFTAPPNSYSFGVPRTDTKFRGGAGVQ